MSILVTMAALVLVFLYTVLITEDGIVMIMNYFDPPSLIIILLLTIPVLISAGMLKDFIASFKRAFSEHGMCTRVELQRSMEAVRLAQKTNSAAGFFGFLVSFVYVCRDFGTCGEEFFWLNMSVAIISIVYAVVINLVLLAVYGRLKKRYIDFMQMGYEMPEKEPERTAVVPGTYDVAEAGQGPDDKQEQA